MQQLVTDIAGLDDMRLCSKKRRHGFYFLRWKYGAGNPWVFRDSGDRLRGVYNSPETACKFISSWAYMHSQGKDIIKLIGFSYLRSSQAHWIGQRTEKTYLQILFHLA